MFLSFGLCTVFSSCWFQDWRLFFHLLRRIFFPDPLDDTVSTGLSRGLLLGVNSIFLLPFPPGRSTIALCDFWRFSSKLRLAGIHCFFGLLVILRNRHSAISILVSDWSNYQFFSVPVWSETCELVYGQFLFHPEAVPVVGIS